MSDISKAIDEYKRAIDGRASLIAVSKTFPASDIQEAYASGQRDFGENKVQELSEKYEQLPKDIRWHMIGHLQTNKIKYIAPYVYLIHAVDSLHLLAAIDKEARKVGRVIDVLLQVHIAQEETKFGFTPDELMQFLSDGQWRNLPNVRICGLMAVGSFTDDTSLTQREFSTVKSLLDECKRTYFADQDCFCQLSLGMTHDFLLALQHGSTLVRIGNGIFGKRYYQQ